MAIKNNFWKSLIGENAQIMIAGAVAYTSQATIAAFQANAAAGELGVFDGDTNALVSGGGAAAVTENLYIAVKRDLATETTVIFKIQDIKPTRTAYSAPVKQVTTVQCGGFLVIQDITYVNETPNPVTVNYVVAGNSTALSVVVTGNNIVVNEATSSGEAATSTATLIQAAIAASATASALVTSTVTGTGATVQVSTVNPLAIAGTPAIVPGNAYELDLLEFTPGYQPFPTYDYQYVAKVGDTLDTVLQNLANQYNSTTSIDNQNRDVIVTAAYTAGTNSIVFTAINFGVSFKALPKFALQPYAIVTNTTPMHIGTGFPDQMELLQDGGDIFKGVTTNYPLQGANPADFGKPTDMVSQSLGYNIYVFSGFSSERSKLNRHREQFWRTVVVAVPSTGTTPEVQVKAIFGL